MGSRAAEGSPRAAGAPTAKIKQIERDEEEEKTDDGEEDESPLAELKKQAKEIKKGLGKLDKRLRRPSDSKGIPGGVWAMSEVSRARSMISSTWDRPSPAALEYLARAERLLQEILVDYNKYFEEDVTEFKKNVEAANLELLPPAEPIEVKGDR